MILAETDRLGRPAQHRVALDFGCGVGRLTQAIAAHFATTHGLDIAPTMVERARELADQRGVGGCRFAVQRKNDLGTFESGAIDFVCSLLVLQHLESDDAVLLYVREFVRVLAAGGVAVFQLPTEIPASGAHGVRARVGLRRRVTGALRAVGASPRMLYARLGWRPPMPMRALPEVEVRDAVAAAGGSTLGVTALAADYGGVRSALYYVTGPAG
jgi:SAM-dependent methyltransferase